MPFNLVQQAYANSDTCKPGSGEVVNLFGCPTDSKGDAIFSTSNPTFLSLSAFTNHLVRNVFILAGVILFLMIIYAGFKMVQGTKTSFDEGKGIITNALIGFLIMFCSYWIVQIVEFITGAGILLT